MAVRVVIDRRRCIGAGSCLVLAPSAFQWRKGDFLKPELLDQSTVDDDVLREVAAACPTQAIVLEEVVESLVGTERVD
ncbi:MAG TPA: ferredoxin [Acidimicrobiia bacterium]|nr:ferredoxin [Acidimicrobiia bacterium]